jgi:DNA-binding MarR family transcriptional regulator
MEQSSTALQAYGLLEAARSKLSIEISSFLKKHGVTASQYSILRVLQDAGVAGLQAGQVATRMLTQNPDSAKVVNHMIVEGFVTKESHQFDRRVRNIKITKKGSELIQKLDGPFLELLRTLFNDFREEELKLLCSLLSKL